MTDYLPLPDKQYSIIYADPPWKYGGGKNKKTFQGLASVHYETMKTRDICALPVKDIQAKGAVLFLWVTPPQLVEGIKVMEAWGFKYKTVGFTWIKTNRDGSPFFGLGYWTRSNAEYCLIGVSGNHPKRTDNTVSQIVMTPKEAHSKKPDVVRERIVQLMGDLPRIELFARQRADGWDAWGNEIKEEGRENNFGNMW